MTASLNKLLLDNIHTKEQLDSLVSELAQLVASLYKSDEGSYEQLLKKGISGSTAAFVELHVKDATREVLIKKLNAVIGILKEIKTMRLTFGFEPTDEAIENIHHWVLSNMDNLYVLEINYEPKILGGIIIEYNGHFGDYSLRTKVAQHMASRKDEIISRIK